MPREGHDDLARVTAERDGAIFLSTCPVRGTTAAEDEGLIYPDDISIHVPREGHDFVRSKGPTIRVISIHVPREGHDWMSSR